MVAVLFGFTRVIMASAEDTRILLERLRGKERALLKQQAQHRAAAAQAAGNGGSGVVDYWETLGVR